MAKRRKARRKAARKTRARVKRKTIRIREDQLRPIVREAARTGLVEAIEHCHNFWAVSDGYKKYIDRQIEAAAEVLRAVVRTVLREELARPRRKR